MALRSRWVVALAVIGLLAVPVVLDPAGAQSEGSIPAGPEFFLSNWNQHNSFMFPFGDRGDLPVVGDWNGDGHHTVGVFRGGSFFLTNDIFSAFADQVLRYGDPGDTPVVGDWNGDGIDTVGVYRNGTFFLSDTNASVFSDRVLRYGDPGDTPVVGDWNGDGIDTVGVYRNGTFFLSDTNASVFSDLYILYGNSGDIPLAGDWNDVGSDGIGVFRPYQPPPPPPPPLYALEYAPDHGPAGTNIQISGYIHFWDPVCVTVTVTLPGMMSAALSSTTMPVADDGTFSGVLTIPASLRGVVGNWPLYATCNGLRELFWSGSFHLEG